MAIDRMHWFTTKIIPLIYDDSLSYYEFLCKVLVKMNECIDTVNDMSAELTSFETWTTGQFEAVRQELAAAITEVNADIAALQTLVNNEVTRLDGRIDTATTDINAEITALDTRITNQINALSALIALISRNSAAAYNPSSTYHHGDFCVYEGKFYVCLDETTTGTFDTGAWRTAKVDEELQHSWDLITAEYDPTQEYVPGDYCFYYPYFYRCTVWTDDPAGTFDFDYWTRTTVTDEINRVSSSLANSITAVSNRVTAAETAIDDILNDIAVEFSISASYTVGTYVIYENKLYRALENISAGAWDSTKWLPVDLTTELNAAKSGLSDRITATENQLAGYTIWCGTSAQWSQISHNNGTIYFIKP